MGSMIANVIGWTCVAVVLVALLGFVLWAGYWWFHDRAAARELPHRICRKWLNAAAHRSLDVPQHVWDIREHKRCPFCSGEIPGGELP